MSTPQRETLLDAFNAVVLWLLLGFSLMWYHTVTYLPAGGWPLPHPEALGGLTGYFHSQLYTHSAVQLFHWLVLFPLAGVLWVALLALTAPYFGGRHESFTGTLWRFSLASLPLCLPGPYFAWIAGARGGGWNMGAMVQTLLGAGNGTPRSWVLWLYTILAVCALLLQVRAHRKSFHLRGQAGWKHVALTLVLYLVIMTGAATLAAYPLRYFFEFEI